MPYKRRYPYIHFDIETYSEVDLTECGHYVYFSHPSTDVLCISYNIEQPLGDGKDHEWRPGDRPPLALFDAISKGAMVLAHNCAFDAEGWCKVLAEKYGWVWPGYDAFMDSMSAALLVNLPGNLDRASRFFPGTPPKDKEGHLLMKKMCRPATPLKAEKEGRIPRDPKRHHTPENLKRLAKYCTIDIKAEGGFYDQIPDMSEFEEQCWRATWAMNRRGVLVDVGLVQNCQEIAHEVHKRYRADLKELTGGLVEKETQRAPLAKFLEENGLVLPRAKDGKLDPNGNPSFGKDFAHLVDDTNANELAKKGYDLYQTLNNASHSKLDTMMRCLGYDNRIRGMTQFSGAGQTGRWAGRFVQLQNLPQGILKGPEQYEFLRQLIMEGTCVDTLECLYGNAMDAVSSMIRACLIAPGGSQLRVADYRSIEGRVLAWAAGESEVVQAYRDGMDMYKVAAMAIFGVSYDDVTDAMRKVGKVAELACLGGDTPVLTPRGWVPLVDVRRDDFVFDGRCWVRHGGVVARGEKTATMRSGIWVTDDHLILEDDETWVRADKADWSKARALATSKLLASKPEFWAASSLFSVGAFNAVASVAPRLGTSRTAELLGALPVGVKLVSGHERGLVSIWTLGLDADSAIESAPSLLAATTQATPGIRTTAHAVSWFMRTGFEIELRLYGISPHSQVQKTLGLSWTASTWTWDTSRGISASYRTQLNKLIDRTQCGWNGGESACVGPIFGGDTPRNTAERGQCLGNFVKEYRLSKLLMNNATAVVPTFDIKNAGPHNRFMVLTDEGPMLVHNCGYQGGLGAFLAMGGRQLGLTDERINSIVKAWRSGRPKTVALWDRMNKAALKAMRNPKKRFDVGPFAFAYNRRDLRMRLPSGRLLYYRNAKITDKIWPDGGKTPQITYYGVNKNQVGWLTTYGGKLTENAIQATARELMAYATVNAHKAGWNLTMTVHDELVSEESDRDHNMLCALMEDTPSWSSGLPIDAAGFSGAYYRK